MKYKYIAVTKEWFDKINGNSYFSVQIEDVEKDITYKGKESSSTQHILHTLHQPIMTITDQVEEARAAGHKTVNEIVKYAANKNRSLGRSEVERCLKRQEKM